MKKLLLLAAFGCCANVSFAQSEADQKAWMDYVTPGAMQKMLAEESGTWKEETTMWMEPGAEPMKMNATVVSETILDGRYQQQTHKGDFGGMPFHGISTTGYDNARQVFVSTWIDNMGTGIMTVEGTYNAATKTINMKGTTTDPMTKKAIPIREEIVLVDKDHQIIRQYMMHKGKEFKGMEIKLTRG
jgi:hypothetical protein